MSWEISVEAVDVPYAEDVIRTVRTDWGVHCTAYVHSKPEGASLWFVVPASVAGSLFSALLDQVDKSDGLLWDLQVRSLPL